MQISRLRNIFNCIVIAIFSGITMHTNVSFGDEAQIKKYQYQLTIVGAYLYDTQAGQDSDTEKFLSVEADEQSSKLLRRKFGKAFTGIVVVENPSWVLSKLGIPKKCHHLSRSGDTIKITLRSFSHPIPFDNESDWLSAKAVKVISVESSIASGNDCKNG